MLAIDYLYDFPVPVSYLCTVMALCLALCWGCVWCFDAEEKAELDESSSVQGEKSTGSGLLEPLLEL